jgi:uncharacterized protein (TIGR02996 family)
MTEQDAFLAAILANPADDLPRLVFADWLDENKSSVCRECEGSGIRRDLPIPIIPGISIDCRPCCGTGQVVNTNAERAEFIRVQCELASLSVLCNGHCDPRLCKQCGWRQRERDLFNAHAVEWFPSAPASQLILGGDTAGGPWHVVRRGFVAEVRCRLADWCGGECPNCVGSLRRVGIGRAQHLCEVCDGTGTTPGIGGRLVAEHPIELLAITDILPAEVGEDGPHRSYYWWRANPRPVPRNRRADADEIPADVFRQFHDFLIAPDESGPYRFQGWWSARPCFSTRDGAVLAAGHAYLLRAKETHT